MKLKLFFVPFVIFSIVLSKDFKSSSIEKAFVNIAKDLAQHSRQISVIFSGTFEYIMDPFTIAKIAEVPHTVARLERLPEIFTLTTSSIVLLDSLSSLEEFNLLSKVSLRFLRSKQLIIHINNGTFEQIAKIKKADLSHYEYFMIEDENSIRLLTFVKYTPEKCGTDQLVEVNSFNKTL